MSNEICKEMNPNCLVIACCSKPCEDLKWRIESKLVRIGAKHLYEFYQNHIVNKQTCPRCNREEVSLLNSNSNRYVNNVVCLFCERAFHFQLGF